MCDGFNARQVTTAVGHRAEWSRLSLVRWVVSGTWPSRTRGKVVGEDGMISSPWHDGMGGTGDTDEIFQKGYEGMCFLWSFSPCSG